MQYAVAFLDHHYKALIDHLFSNTMTEQAAFILGRRATDGDKTTILVRKIIPVEAADIISASKVHMEIRSAAYLRALKEADSTGQCFFFAHTHPDGKTIFSNQDDQEEEALFKTAYVRIHNSQAVHGSIVFNVTDSFAGRVWLENGTTNPITLLRIVGERFRCLYAEKPADYPSEYFDRQARAFTAEIQPMLKRMHIGVVGAGGTGSATCEQLIRLGIGTLTVVDNGLFEKSNVNRVRGSGVFDEKLPKVNIVARMAAEIGLGTVVNCIEGHLSFRSIAKKLRSCDVIFGCTDDEWGRSILNRIPLWYYIPVIDMGVAIDTDDDCRIRSIQGRVTTLLPGAACLYCRGRISSKRVRAESIAASNPEEAERLRKEGYLANMDEPAPAVVTFTSGISALAVSEFLHRITGFKGNGYATTEVLCFFDQNRVRTNSTQPSSSCMCGNSGKWGMGDMNRFLDLSWRQE